MPFISICIPAYQRTGYLKRLLDSVAVQSYKDFEVIVTDDSPTPEVEELCGSYKAFFNISYIKNAIQLGTPENWNEAIRHASGQWIKLMHDDDWFTHEGSLAAFASAAEKHTGAFIFSAYNNIWLDKNDMVEQMFPSQTEIERVKNEPATLLASNIIGPPSVIMHKNDKQFFYDTSLKWLVDIEYYYHRLKKEEIFFIEQPVINVGMSNTQVTVSCHNIPEVELPEHFYYLHKIGTNIFKNIWVYDAWWRLFRNLGIRNIDQLKQYVNETDIIPVIAAMLNDQKKITPTLLRVGVASKILMCLSYLKNKRKVVI